MLNQKGLVGYQQISASRFVRGGGATNRTGFGHYLCRQRTVVWPVRHYPKSSNGGIVADGFK